MDGGPGGSGSVGAGGSPVDGGGGGAPAKLGQGSACTAGSECLSSNCIDGVCCDSACGGACQACTAVKKGSGTDGTCGVVAANLDPDNECAGAATCNGAGVCQLKPSGAACSAGTECQSGFCPTQDGVCCATACGGLCNSCLGANTGGANGTCGPITSGKDPSNECAGSATCNGSGGCSLAPNGATCKGCGNATAVCH